MRPVTKQFGFTLIEAIIYIALFSIIFTGLFVSVYPILTGAERLTNNVAADSETAFLLTKINYAIGDTITSSTGSVTTPATGATANELVLTNGGESYHFAMSNSGCTGPVICRLLTLREGGASALPLNNSRVRITGFSATHSPAGTLPKYLDVSFAANGATTTARYYLRF